MRSDAVDLREDMLAARLLAALEERNHAATVHSRHRLDAERIENRRRQIHAGYQVLGVDLARPGQEITATVTATSLFGPPAAGRTARATVNYARAPVGFPDWPGFVFGDPDDDRNFSAQILSTLPTDDAGKATWQINLPHLASFDGLVRAPVRAGARRPPAPHRARERPPHRLDPRHERP